MSEKSRLNNKLITNKTTRQAYIWSKVTTSVASQIRALRRRRGHMTQQALAQDVEMKQSRISAMERPGTRFNIETLVRLASTFKVGLVVKFVSFSEMLKWENGYSQDAFNVPIIDVDTEFQKGEAYRQSDEALSIKIEVPESTGKILRTTVPADYLRLEPPKIVPLVVANDPIRNVPRRSPRGYETAIPMSIQ